MGFKKKCIVCGSEFETSYAKRLVCSDDCREIHKRTHQKDYYYNVKTAKKQERLMAKVNKANSVYKSHRILWDISRRCEEMGLSYGYAVAFGFVEG